MMKRLTLLVLVVVGMIVTLGINGSALSSPDVSGGALEIGTPVIVIRYDGGQLTVATLEPSSRVFDFEVDVASVTFLECGAVEHVPVFAGDTGLFAGISEEVWSNERVARFNLQQPFDACNILYGR